MLYSQGRRADGVLGDVTDLGKMTEKEGPPSVSKWHRMTADMHAVTADTRNRAGGAGRPAWRRRLRWGLTGASIVLLGASGLAFASGGTASAAVSPGQGSSYAQTL